jgi:hypothetical protein
MVDACTVRAVTGVTVNGTTGVSTPTYSTLYTGKCKVQSDSPRAANPDQGGTTMTVQRSRVDFPVGSFTPAIGHVITITASDLDPGLVGRMFRVVALLHKSMATTYRLAVEETTT